MTHRGGNSHELRLRKPVNAAAEGIERFERCLRLLLSDVAPGDGETNTRLRFVQRPTRCSEAHTCVTRVIAEGFRDIEPRAAKGPPNLTCEIPIRAVNGLDQWPCQGNQSRNVL